jgi:hypothetical protein
MFLQRIESTERAKAGCETKDSHPAHVIVGHRSGTKYFLPPTPPTAIIPAVVADISTIVPQFTAILPNLAPIAGKLASAGTVVQITPVLSPVPVEFPSVLTHFMTIVPEIRRSRRSHSKQPS